MLPLKAGGRKPVGKASERVWERSQKRVPGADGYGFISTRTPPLKMCLLRIALLFSAAVCGGFAQILAPFGPSFGPLAPFPPPPFITLIVFPPVKLQAKAGGGLRASIPDDCGIESFEFESKMNKTDEWKGGNVTSKTEGNWIFDDPSVLLAPGDLLFYRCRIKQRGSYISNPDAEWVVDGLVDEFDPPRPAIKPKDCPEEPTTPKPDDKKEETTAKPDEDEDETTDNPDDDSTDKPEKKKSDQPEKKKPDQPEKQKSDQPEKQKSDQPEKQKPDKPEKNKSEGPKTGDCPAPPPQPGETREESLERKLWQVQCDMLQLAERSFRINEALSNELTELKKLNYIVVTRIQRLESLVRNLNRPAPFPSVFPFN